MKVSDKMTRNPRVASPDDAIRDAAGVMAQADAGVLPVGENDRLVGMVTDRDIAVRAVAQGKGPETKVREVMTPDVQYCFEDEDLGPVAATMAEQQLRRLPVVSRDKRLVGILSLGDLAAASAANANAPDFAGRALEGVAREGGAHSQPAAAE